MSTMKRCISLLLVLGIILGVLVPAAQAAPVEETASVNTDNVTIEGTNGFGNLLSQEIAESQEEAETAEAEYPGGYTVTDLVIEGNTAKVTYDTMENATVVVALYTEDGMQMLTSTTATVTPDATEAELTFAGDMPEYFMASAYLLDVYDFSPLCAAYDTPMYTQEMQELLSSTVNDYDPEKVLNLDDDETTNFAVYSDSTIVIEPVEGVNVVASVDEETLTYVIEDVDATISTLVEGDVLVYRYDDNEIIIVKVANITTEGTTSIITGAEIEMEDVFSAVKIEGKSDTNEVVVDDSTADQGVAFEGIQAKGTPGYGTDSLEGGGSFEYELVYKIDKTANYGSITEKIEGKLGIGLETSIDYYISGNRQFIEFAVDYYLLASISAEGTLKTGIPLGKFSVVPVFGVYCYFEPELSFEAKGAVEIEIKCGSFTKTVFESGKGLTCYVCDTGCTFDGTKEIEYFIGLDLNPGIAIIDKAILNMQLSAKTGLILTVKPAGKNAIVMDSSSEVIHSCNICFDLELSFSAEFKVTMFLLGCKERAIGPVKLEMLIFEAYRSTDYDEFLPGNCPHLEYRITAKVTDELGNGIPGIEVRANDESVWGVTNIHGVIVKYLPSGKYTIQAVVNGEKLSKVVDVGEAMLVTLNALHDKTDGYRNIFDRDLGDDTIDYGAVVASGTCGDNIVWTLYSSGFLDIVGTGTMYNYSYAGAPWQGYSTPVKMAVISEGITSVGDEAFYLCDLENVKIPDSVTSIGARAFADTYLEYIKIPRNVSIIGEWPFALCRRLTYIEVDLENAYFSNDQKGALFNKEKNELVCFPGGVAGAYAIPESVTTIGDNAFYHCFDLSGVEIPLGVTSVGSSAFECTSLKSITIPSSVASIGGWAFSGCYELSEMFFTGNAPTFGRDWYSDVAFTAYYPANNATWTDVISKYVGSNITWVPYTLSNSTSIISPLYEILVQKPAIEIEAVYGGEYTTEITEEATIKTASFTNLVPGEQYVMLAMVNIGAGNPIAAENLLAIDQAVAAEDGTLIFRYIQRIPADLSHVVVCGASTKNLKDAVITFPEMKADGDLHVVEPSVFYDGTTLIAGQDYVITGRVDFTEGGEYICYIRGIRDYTGIVECTYKVKNSMLANPFNDVAPGSFFYEPVMWAIENGITNGTSATTFGPNDQCMRAHVVTFLWRAVGSPEPTRTDNPFVDVKPTDFYYKPVLWAVENGITSGMDATHFGPTAYCNRAQVVTFLYRTMGSPDVGAATNPFTDVAAGSFYEKPVLWAVENGVTAGLSATSFGPNSICNRAQIVTFLYRAFVD